MLIIILFLRPYLYQLHHSNWVEEVKATESVLPVGGAGDVTDRQRGRVTGKDGVPKERNQHISQTSVNKAEMCPFIAIINFPFRVVLNLLYLKHGHYKEGMQCLGVMPVGVHYAHYCHLVATAGYCLWTMASLQAIGV